MALRGFLDESDRGREYLMCLSLVQSSAISNVRTALRGLLLPGMPRFHMKNEQPRLKRVMLSTIERLDVSSVIVKAGHIKRREARAEILRRVVAEFDVDRLVLESRESQDHEDRQVLHDAVRKTGKEKLRYGHERPASEPLLWVPDALVWAYGKGGDWRHRARRSVDRVIEIREP